MTNFQAPPPIPLVQLRPKFFQPIDLECPISSESLSPSPNDDQSIKRKHNRRMSSCLSFRSVFVFSTNSLILFGLPLTSFHLAEVSLSAFWWLYTLVYAVVQKYQEMSFIYNYLHFQYSFCNQPVLFAQLKNVNKLWENNCTMHVNKQLKNKNKTKSRHIQIDDLAHKKSNGFIKGWRPCLTSESKVRFLSIIIVRIVGISCQ